MTVLLSAAHPAHGLATHAATHVRTAFDVGKSRCSTASMLGSSEYDVAVIGGGPAGYVWECKCGARGSVHEEHQQAIDFGIQHSGD